MTTMMVLALWLSAVITWRAMSRLFRVKPKPTPQISRWCNVCCETENEHANGQCLFDTTKFTPHRLQGDSVPAGLWTPVVIDVVVSSKPITAEESFAGISYKIGATFEDFAAVERRIIASTGLPREFLGYGKDDE